LGPPNPSGSGEGQCRRRRNWVQAVGGVPGVIDDDMSRQNTQRKHGTTHGSPRRKRTAKAPPISRPAAKWRRAREWGGWGRLSDDGPGQNNLDRSEGPWGRAARSLERRCATKDRSPTQSGLIRVPAGRTKGGGKLGRRGTWTPHGKAPPERPALKPYWGKPAVRNFRGDDGNVGIIRSPVRAIVLPD
jgi:hypothetical protein